MVDTTDEDYTFARRVCKDFEIKNLGEYHDFHVQNNTLLLKTNMVSVCYQNNKVVKNNSNKFTTNPFLFF